MTVMNTTIQESRDMWVLLFPGVDPPSDQQFALWALLHDASTIRKGLGILATKHQSLRGEMTPLYMGKFLSSVMNRLASRAAVQQIAGKVGGARSRTEVTEIPNQQ